jgi:5'-3' exonuclease
MILVDLNQTLISALMVHGSKIEINEKLVRHIALSSLLHFKQKFSGEYGEMILCDDGRNYWRKDIFPYYKQNRIARRKESPFDWKNIFRCLDVIKSELKSHFPYKFICIERAEADDVIATLCGSFPNEKKLILSNDQDLLQLQKFPNVRQFSPTQKRFITSDLPKKQLLEKILRGDPGDGVPNILSDDDTFMNAEKRQTPLRSKRIEEWLSNAQSFKEFLSNEQYKKNFQRNSLTIDLSNVPEYIRDEVLKEFEWQKPKKTDFINYFIKHNLKLLASSANEF